MFAQKWRQHWGLSEDPFGYEDADKDIILTEVDASAVHSSFDRIYGNPKAPAPGIIFGEKGSGKSALRLMMSRRITQYNEAHPDEKTFLIEYIDFNTYIEQFRQRTGIRRQSQQAVRDVIDRWKIADHLDCILSLGVTKLVDEQLAQKKKPRNVSRKPIIDLLLFTSLYYNSDRLTVPEALRKLRSQVGGAGFRSARLWALWIFLALVGLFIGFTPHIFNASFPAHKYWYGLGALVIFATSLWGVFNRSLGYSIAGKASRSVKILPRDAASLTQMILNLSPKERKEFVLPRGSNESSRYQLLHRFLGVLEIFGYRGIYVLIDRIDEPSLFSGNNEAMKQFIEKILDIKLLQYPQLGMKLFLPIELDEIYRNATPEQLKRIRLDKSNVVPELKWSGQELFEIANQRMQACPAPDSEVSHLSGLFEEDFDFNHLRETLTALGTPRYAFGFFSSLFTEYVKDLPNELSDNDPRWKIPRAHFDIIRAAWLDRSGVLRRVLN